MTKSIYTNLRQNISCPPCILNMTSVTNSDIKKPNQPILKSYMDFNCTQEWTAFVVPFRKREEHLPHFLEAITKHQLRNSQNNVSYFHLSQNNFCN